VPSPECEEPGPVDGVPLPVRMVRIIMLYEVLTGELTADPAVFHRVTFGTGIGLADPPEGHSLYVVASCAVRFLLPTVVLAFLIVYPAWTQPTRVHRRNRTRNSLITIPSHLSRLPKVATMS